MALTRMGRTVIAMAASAVSGVANAQDFPGDPAAGAIYAESACAECHAIGAKEPPGLLMAPSFVEVANRPSTTGMSLLAWLTSVSHPSMPDLIIPPEKAKDVVAYILTLRTR